MIVHLMHDEKFIEPFMIFIDEYFEPSQHLYLVRSRGKFPIAQRDNSVIIGEDANVFTRLLIYAKYLNRADRIMLHGMPGKERFLILLFQPWLLKKSYWFMWGGDLYHYRYRSKSLQSDFFEVIRKFVIKRLGHIVTYLKGDYEIARKVYGAAGEYKECLLYPSNLYKEYEIPPKTGGAINILVGNSADMTNNHFDAFDKLSVVKDQDIMIYCPLSYGDKGYAQLVIAKGTEVFGSKFVPFVDFMSLGKYMKVLSQIDIAVFNHDRQQGMGNIISLLGLGKKVYLRSGISTWSLFDEMGVEVFDLAEFGKTYSQEFNSSENSKKIKNYFSIDNFKEQLKDLFC